MKLIRFIKATASEIRIETKHQLWMAVRNYHSEYSDFSEFLQDAEWHYREVLHSIKVQSMTDAEWEVYKHQYYK
jgi:hypothetical protein